MKSDTVTTEHADFSAGYQIGINSLEQLSENVDSKGAEYETLILLGILTVLLECAYRSMPENGVDEMMEIAKELAQSAADEPQEMVH